MLKVQRANVVLDIEDDDLSKYMNLGFNLIDETGGLLKEAVPTDVDLLRKYYMQYKTKITELEAEIEKLKHELNEKKKVVKAKEK